MSTWTYVGRQINVHTCPCEVGGWSKMVKILSTWLLDDPIQGFLIQLHIKLTKVLTKNNNLSQNFF